MHPATDKPFKSQAPLHCGHRSQLEPSTGEVQHQGCHIAAPRRVAAHHQEAASQHRHIEGQPGEARVFISGVASWLCAGMLRPNQQTSRMQVLVGVILCNAVLPSPLSRCTSLSDQVGGYQAEAQHVCRNRTMAWLTLFLSTCLCNAGLKQRVAARPQLCLDGARVPTRWVTIKGTFHTCISTQKPHMPSPKTGSSHCLCFNRSHRTQGFVKTPPVPAKHGPRTATVRRTRSSWFRLPLAWGPAGGRAWHARCARLMTHSATMRIGSTWGTWCLTALS